MSPFEERPSLLLDRLADRADYAVIGPMDGRTRVANASTIRTPPSATSCPTSSGMTTSTSASGFLIFPDVVLTAAHNVYILRPGRTRRAVPSRYRVTPGRNGAGAPPFGTQPAIHLYVPQRFVAASVRDLRLRLHQNGPTVPGPSRRIPSRRPDRRGSAAGAVAPSSAYRGLSLRQVVRNMWEHAKRLDRFTPHSLHYSVDTGGDSTEVRSGCGVIVPVRSTAIGIHVCGPPGYDEGECARGIVRAPRLNQSGRADHARIDRDGSARPAGTPHPDLVQLR